MKKKQRFAFKGELRDNSILIGSHGDAIVEIDGIFDLSGTIYCPKYTVTLFIKGEGKVTFRGKCRKLITKQMEGNCILDISDLTSKELRFESMKDQTVVITGRTRVISQANLSDEAILNVAENPLITNSQVSGSSKIVHRTFATSDVMN
jgi:hypothetical protein